MIANTLRGRYRDVALFHVRMSFSRELREGGRLRPRKITHLLAVIVKIALARARTKATTLYYPPSGPGGVPMYRDMAILLATRWMFSTTIFHHHAGGLSQAYASLAPAAKPLYRRAFFHPDVGIRTSPLAPADPARLHARHDVVVLNGVEDAATGTPADAFVPRRSGIPTILFVGLLSESKGVFVLLDACAELKRRAVPFRVELVGEFPSERTRANVERRVRQAGLEEVVQARGVLVGAAKHRAYAAAAVLAFPTFFESETFGLVLIEAMQFSLPVVATSWRGIPAVVEDGVNGFLVPVGDAGALADRLAQVLTDRAWAERLGRRGRQAYEERFRLDRFHRDMQAVFDTVRAETAP